jgi:hypothetical protein
LDTGELSDDDLQKVAGGSTPLISPEIKLDVTIPAPTQSNPGKTNAGWDIAINSTP